MTEGDSGRDRMEFLSRPSPQTAEVTDVSELARQFDQLARALLKADTVAGVLTDVVQATAEVIPDADLVSMTLRSPDGELHTPARTDPVGTELDHLQNHHREGPCFDAARLPDLSYTHSPDLAATPQWPWFGPAAAELGYRSVLSTALLPGLTPRRLSGALNIYSRTLGRLGDPESVDRALLLATHASLAVANTEAVRLAELRETQLRRALDTRDVIGQAKGILMRSRGITAEEAFDLLRRTSQDLNIKLAALAETLTTRHTELDPPAT